VSQAENENKNDFFIAFSLCIRKYLDHALLFLILTHLKHDFYGTTRDSCVIHKHNSMAIFCYPPTSYCSLSASVHFGVDLVDFRGFQAVIKAKQKSTVVSHISELLFLRVAPLCCTATIFYLQ